MSSEGIFVRLEEEQSRWQGIFSARVHMQVCNNLLLIIFLKTYKKQTLLE